MSQATERQLIIESLKDRRWKALRTAKRAKRWDNRIRASERAKLLTKLIPRIKGMR